MDEPLPSVVSVKQTKKNKKIKNNKKIQPILDTNMFTHEQFHDESSASASESDLTGEEDEEEEYHNKKAKKNKEKSKLMKKIKTPKEMKSPEKKNKSNTPTRMNHIEPPSPSDYDEESVIGNNTIIRQATYTDFTDPKNRESMSDNPKIKALILALEQQGMINQHSPKETVNVLESAHKVIERQRSKIQALNTPCLDYYCEQLCWSTQFAFSISSLVLLILYATHNHPAGFVNTFFVQSIAAVAYFVKASHAGEVVIAGTHIPFVRYVDWITTTPLMLYELCHIAHAPVYAIVMIIGCDLMTLSLGITAAVIDQKKHLKVKYTLFLVAVGFYIMMVCTLIMDVAKPLHDKYSSHRLLAGSDDYGDDDGHDNSAVVKLFNDLEVLTIVSWSFYPFAVLLGRAHFGIITQSVEDGFICILDIISKIGMEGIIIAYVVNHH